MALMCLTAAWLLAGCGDTPVIQVGRAPAGNHSASIAPPLDNGLASFDAWPKACQYITDRDIKAVMPQASGITHKVYDVDFHLTSEPTYVTHTAKGVGCSMTWWLPGAENGQVVPTVNLDLDFKAVGDPAIVRQNAAGHPPSVVPDPAVLGGDQCWQSVESYECQRQDVLFELHWVGNPTVKRYAGQGSLASGTFWHDRVAVEFVKVVTGKLP